MQPPTAITTQGTATRDQQAPTSLPLSNYAWTPLLALELANRLSPGSPAAAALALDEAAVRFPNHPDREAWQWQAAGLDAAAGNAEEAASRYADLLQSAWEAGNSPQGLVETFAGRQGTPGGLPIAARLTSLAAADGETRALLEMEAGDFRGGACLAISAGPTGRTVTPLYSRFSPLGSPPRTWVVCRVVDVDGDGIDEILIETGLGGAQLTQEQSYRIVSLATALPQTLRFSRDSSELVFGVGGGTFAGVDSGPDGRRLHFIETPGYRCPPQLYRWLAWNGAWLANAAVELHFDENLPSQAGCLSGLAERLDSLPPQLAAPLIRTLLDEAPSGDPIYTGPVERQEWALRLGVQLALAGAAEPARSALQDAAAQPDPGLSARAAAFLDAYSQAGGLFRACAAEPFCRPERAIQALLEQASPAIQPAGLEAAGLDGGMDREWDFENDGQAERLLTLPQAEGEGWDLWVLADWNGRLAALNAGGVLSAQPALAPYSDLYTPEAVRIDEMDIVAFRRAPLTGQPYLTRHSSNPQPDFTAIYRAAYSDLRARLFAGEDPAAVRRELDVLQQQPAFACAGFCPGLIYLSALTAELSNDPGAALALYRQLVRDYPDDPHAVLAQGRVTSP